MQKEYYEYNMGYDNDSSFASFISTYTYNYRDVLFILTKKNFISRLFENKIGNENLPHKIQDTCAQIDGTYT